jgi:uncharacterized protein with HEPN domain
MSRRDDATSLRHIIEHGREVIEHVRGKTLHDLEADRSLPLAVTRLLEILGEASRRLSSEFRAAHPEVPWNEIAGMRNRLVHAYDEINLGVVWHTATRDVPRLLQLLEPLDR